MSTERKSFWGTAVGLDLAGDKQRINIFKASGGFHFVDVNLDSCYRQLPSEEHVKAEVAAIFRLRDVKLEIPRLGIYSSQKPPATPVKPEMAAKTKPGTWGKVLETKKPKR